VQSSSLPAQRHSGTTPGEADEFRDGRQPVEKLLDPPQNLNRSGHQDHGKMVGGPAVTSQLPSDRFQTYSNKKEARVEECTWFVTL